jgi:hypothetical protein
MSKVPNCGFGGAYHIDFLGMPFRVSLPQFVREIVAAHFKNSGVMPGLRDGHSAATL